MLNILTISHFEWIKLVYTVCEVKQSGRKEEAEKLLSAPSVFTGRCDYPLLDLSNEIHLVEMIRAIRLSGRLTKRHQHSVY